jgi:hypothetical protein
MSGSPPHEPADDAHGPGTAADPQSNAGQCPIQYPGFASVPQTHPAYRLSLPSLIVSLVSDSHSRCYRCSSKARQRSPQGLEE